MFAVPAPSAGPIKRMSRIGATRLISLITQGNRLRPVEALGGDLRGSWAGAAPNSSAMSPLALFLPLMIRGRGGVAGTTAGVGGDDSVNATRTLT
jgi:hypothetical protein